MVGLGPEPRGDLIGAGGGGVAGEVKSGAVKVVKDRLHDVGNRVAAQVGGNERKSQGVGRRPRQGRAGRRCRVQRAGVPLVRRKELRRRGPRCVRVHHGEALELRGGGAGLGHKLAHQGESLLDAARRMKQVGEGVAEVRAAGGAGEPLLQNAPGLRVPRKPGQGAGQPRPGHIIRRRGLHGGGQQRERLLKAGLGNEHRAQVRVDARVPGVQAQNLAGVVLAAGQVVAGEGDKAQEREQARVVGVPGQGAERDGLGLVELPLVQQRVGGVQGGGHGGAMIRAGGPGPRVLGRWEEPGREVGQGGGR